MQRHQIAQRRFQTDEEYEEEQLLNDLESELQQVQNIKSLIQQRVEQLLVEQKHLEQQQRRLHRHRDREDAGTATARMLQLQEREKERLAAAQSKRECEEREAKATAEAAQRRREHAIETQDEEMEDLDAFFIEDTAIL
ncbi:hypothetical protein PsorP6_008396 [Peronosclerospora sorghi]|uniref:Uncharacterized protein n=1 Tax=Peronosclerospora sorghi TaxID=230839 RepID=A0ACC0W6U0_9STRA|nr:hypothetical protein PsorP6_008396 [Peronosclerospora sorghi]